MVTHGSRGYMAAAVPPGQWGCRGKARSGPCELGPQKGAGRTAATCLSAHDGRFSRGFLPGSPLRSPALWLVYRREGVTASQPAVPRARAPLPRHVGPSTRSRPALRGSLGVQVQPPHRAHSKGAVAAHRSLQRPWHFQRRHTEVQTRWSHKLPGGPEGEMRPAAEACVALGAPPEAEPPPRNRNHTQVGAGRLLLPRCMSCVLWAAAHDLGPAPPSSPAGRPRRPRVCNFPFFPNFKELRLI